MTIPDSTDIAVIGAGAAGLMASISAGRARGDSKRPSIFLFDSRNKIGAKILISGGTRCNVTNVKVTPNDYQGASRHYLKHAFEAYTPEKTIAFFEEIGVPLELEPTGKYFPTTHSGATVLAALTKELERVRVPLIQNCKVTSIKKTPDGFELHAEGHQMNARRVILTTGGLSYPETGSDGTGFKIAAAFGHTIEPTYPALTPLNTENALWQSLSGITLEVRLSFFQRNKKVIESQGSFLFTHFGFSGPAALDISRHWAASQALDRHIEASFLPKETDESVTKTIKKHLKSNQFPVNFLSHQFGLPSRLAEVIVQRAGILPRVVMRDMNAGQASRLASGLLHAALEVSGVVGYKKAEVTAGGVTLDEVRISNMESKKVPGLHFAGEILDVDGRIGGFNFQWAWSSGWLAGQGAVKGLL